ncbi:hypothetical protein B5S28_g3085 [[Candida] boidinii]|nr:hypothetical protein B5S28_g3085 [[Candida] boidinii]OWB62957.1 hypothetical protein B5S29_g3908 [[Candida] boidinii]OWB73745.1 hypothetical protein B5S31_g3505 [[Candida] boidinii]OWB79882.1 hypothetical protein B5S32_g4121 [[Candida] boidinii]
MGQPAEELTEFLLTFFPLPRAIIKAKDHASVQINVAQVDEEGKAIPNEHVTYALSGYVRSRGEADDSLNRLAETDGLIKGVWSYSR